MRTAEVWSYWSDVAEAEDQSHKSHHDFKPHPLPVKVHCTDTQWG